MTIVDYKVDDFSKFNIIVPKMFEDMTMVSRYLNSVDRSGLELDIIEFPENGKNQFNVLMEIEEIFKNPKKYSKVIIITHSSTVLNAFDICKTKYNVDNDTCFFTYHDYNSTLNIETEVKYMYENFALAALKLNQEREKYLMN